MTNDDQKLWQTTWMPTRRLASEEIIRDARTGLDIKSNERTEIEQAKLWFGYADGHLSILKHEDSYFLNISGGEYAEYADDSCQISEATANALLSEKGLTHFEGRTHQRDD